jgi:uncharacterized tellurite resistance protein B-like protein
MLKKLFDSYRLVAADAREAIADQYRQMIDPDADEIAADLKVATNRLAAAGVFCEVALANGRIEPTERERLKDLILIRFGLSDDEAEQLLEMGSKAAAAHAARMTASVRDHFSREERIELLEMLFDISFADGNQSVREIEIAQQAGAAIGLRPADIKRARAKIEERVRMLGTAAKLTAEY